MEEQEPHLKQPHLKEATTTTLQPVSKQHLRIPEVAVTEVSSSPSPRPSSSEGKSSARTIDERGRGGEEIEPVEGKEEKSEERRVEESKGARSKVPREKRKEGKERREGKESSFRSTFHQVVSGSKPLTPSPSKVTLQEEEEGEKSIAKGMRLVIESVIETADPESASAIKAVSSLPPAGGGVRPKKSGIHLDLRSQIPKSEDVEEKRSDKLIR